MKTSNKIKKGASKFLLISGEKQINKRILGGSFSTVYCLSTIEVKSIGKMKIGETSFSAN